MDIETTRSYSLESDPKIRKALKDSDPKPKTNMTSSEPRHRVWLGSIFSLLFIFVGLEYLFRLGFFDFLGKYTAVSRRVVVGIVAILVVMAVFRLLDFFYLKRLEDPIAKFNLRRILRLGQGIVIGLVGISVLFAN